ncbi:MAG: AI-2E family transporter [Candidatus Parcubacteria bacterium]|nr:AI-2E family transporter [Candidatus Parcubacteria bacterium]
MVRKEKISQIINHRFNLSVCSGGGGWPEWQKLPDYYNTINRYFNISNQSWDQITRSFFINWISTPGAATKGIFGVLGTVLGGVVASVLVFVISFYLTLQKQAPKEMVKKIVPIKYHAAVGRMADLMQKDVGGWARSLLITAVAVGILNYIGLLAVGVKFALLLAVLGAVGEIIPWVGTWIASALAVLVALLQSPLQAVIIAVYYLLVQEITGHFVFPKLMQRTVGLNPIVVIVVALIGARLGGAIGLILAIPILTIIIILVKEYLRIKKERLLDRS